jgi:hypothetical protein
MSSRIDKLERYYRTLLTAYPREHRERYAEEMLDVVTSTVGHTLRAHLVESASLLAGAARAHLRRLRHGGSARWRGGLAIASLAAPILLVAGAATDLHDMVWFTLEDGPANVPWLADGLVAGLLWLVWPAVAVLAVLGLRRTAIVCGVVATGFLTTVLAVVPEVRVSGPWAACSILLALVTLAGLVAPAGPREGLDRIGRRRVALLATTMVLLVAMRVLGHQYATAYWLVLALLVLGTVLACRPETAEGRRAIILLATPMVP